MTYISSTFPQGAFSLVIEAWFSPAAEQPEGEDALFALLPLEGDKDALSQSDLFPITRSNH